MEIQIKSYCQLIPGKAFLNGGLFFESSYNKAEESQSFLSDLYTRLAIDYRKFFKMDLLSKFGFLASEIVLKDLDKTEPKEDMGIILLNRSSSMEADVNYQYTIQDPNNYYPSPSVFVYTLPNIVTGEIAIRNKIHGETGFYTLPCFDSGQLEKIVANTIQSGGLHSVLAGWVEIDQKHVDIRMMLCQAGNEGQMQLTSHNIEKLFTSIN